MGTTSKTACLDCGRDLGPLCQDCARVAASHGLSPAARIRQITGRLHRLGVPVQRDKATDVTAPAEFDFGDVA